MYKKSNKNLIYLVNSKIYVQKAQHQSYFNYKLPIKPILLKIWIAYMQLI